MTVILEIKDLYVKAEEKEIIKGLNLTIRKGEVHAIMGPNGAGKSTLSHVLAGKKGYEITSGNILFKGKDLLKMSIEERACEGLFLSMQYPIEIPGVSIINFLKYALNAKLKYHKMKELDTISFIKQVREDGKNLNIDNEMLKRSVNLGFSGGEKKKMELLQMNVLKPDFVILDEIDSGLDIDAIKVVADGIKNLKTQNRSFLLITHYQRILEYIKPDFVHVLIDGKIVESGDFSLALHLEEKGYTNFNG